MPSRTRLLLAGATAAGVVAAALAVPVLADSDPTGPRLGLQEVHRAQSGGGLVLTDKHGNQVEIKSDIHGDHGGEGVDMDALSRAGSAAEETTDPTSADERRAATSYVERERALPDPRLRTVRPYPRRTKAPRTVFALANGCYTLVPGGTPLYFKPTELGSYELATPTQ